MASILQKNIWESDSELFELMKKERKRQESGLELIASENFTSLSVLQCLSSCLHNKYSEGLPGQRWDYCDYFFISRFFNEYRSFKSSNIVVVLIDTTVETNLLTRLNCWRRNAPWKLLIWILKNGAATYNLIREVQRISQCIRACWSLTDV